MKLKQLFNELIIVAGAFTVSFFLLRLLSETHSGNRTIDVSLHDTYFVVDISPQLIITLGLFLIAVIYIVKTIYRYFKDRQQNLILLTTLFFLNVFFIKAIKPAVELGNTLSGGWTMAQPLPVQQSQPRSTIEPFFARAADILFYIEMVLLVLLVIVVGITGKNWHVKIRESS